MDYSLSGCTASPCKEDDTGTAGRSLRGVPGVARDGFMRHAQKPRAALPAWALPVLSDMPWTDEQ
jgi:hypothetical protein